MNREEHRAVLMAKYLYAAAEAAVRKAEAGRWADAAIALVRVEGLLARAKAALWLARFGEVRRG